MGDTQSCGNCKHRDVCTILEQLEEVPAERPQAFPGTTGAEVLEALKETAAAHCIKYDRE